MQRLAKLPQELQAQITAGLTDAELDEFNHDWSQHAREDQLPPPGDWQYWMMLAGRGAGKTRAGAEWIRHKVKTGAKRLGIIAPTQADIRQVLIEGDSGILAVSWDRDYDDAGNHMGVPVYEPSLRHRLTWANGATCQGYSAEEPDRLRGPQHEALWCDELAAWQNVNGGNDAWNMALFGLRLGVNPQAIISTTPRPIPIIRELIRDPNCVVTTATTYANPHLAEAFIAKITQRFKDTRLGRQELMGMLLEESEGALWTRDMCEKAHDGKRSEYARVVVAIDPAVSTGGTSALTGIVVAAKGADGRAYVLQDISGRYSPDQWAKKAIDAFDFHKADRLVAEGNQGGDMVRHTLSTVRKNAPIRIVHATRSKQARAEPVAALYEQGRVTHVTPYPELEDQLCTWEPLSGDPSPDRLDALVWALTDLMLGVAETKIVMPFVTGQRRVIPGQ